MWPHKFRNTVGALCSVFLEMTKSADNLDKIIFIYVTNVHDVC